jgi:hypothetical protein
MNDSDACAKNHDTTYAVLWNRDAAVEALNERRIELALSLVELDEAAEHSPGTAAKYLGPSQVKGLGVGSLFRIARALGLRIVLEVDHRATAALLEDSRPLRRNAKQARAGNFAQKCSRRALVRAFTHISEFSWSDIFKAVHRAKAKAKQAEQAAQKAAEKAKAAKLNSSNGRHNGSADTAERAAVAR